jgi:hypothetical protein
MATPSDHTELVEHLASLRQALEDRLENTTTGVPTFCMFTDADIAAILGAETRNFSERTRPWRA